MSYISAIQKGDDVIVWERTEDGERDEKVYRSPLYFYVSDEDGEYETIYGDRVGKFEASSYDEFKRVKAKAEEQGYRMWESDIPAEMRVLSNNYYGVPAPKLHITFFDIEVDYDPEIGFSSVDNPYAPVVSVAMFHMWSNELIVYCIPPTPDWTEEQLLEQVKEREALPTDFKTTIVLCKDERELLLNFIAEIEDSDVICGWNSDLFDTPYIGKRIIEVLGERHLAKLDFPGAKPNWREVKSRMTDKVIGTTLDLKGRIAADYMVLYKKYEFGERASYRLASIEETVGLGLPKLEYTGTLHNLYRKDFPFYIRYNIRDCEILRGFEQKLAYVELANQMYHMSCGLFSHVTGTLKLAELAIINYCHYTLKKVVNNFTKSEIDRQIEGALVLLPQAGMHEYYGSIDINSLYPSAIRSLNISPETLRGQFKEYAKACEAISKGASNPLTLELETGGEITKTAAEWREHLLEYKWAVSGYGTVFDQNEPGIIPTILAEWYDMRKKYQALKKDAGKAGDKELENYYDRLQYVFKIKLNSLYGALTNLYFRFYDLRMGESVTGTGRMILRHQCRKVAETLEGNYNVDFPMYFSAEEAEKSGHGTSVALNGPRYNGKFESDAVIYGDTDSTYFKTFGTNKEEAVKIADAVAAKVNESYPHFMRDTFLCQPGFDNIIKAGREIVSDRGIFVEKKRYILHIIDKEGKSVDEMKVMGLDTKKTSLPREVSIVLNGFIERYLKGEKWDTIAEAIVEYKEQLRNTPAKDIIKIGLPKGISAIDYFYDRTEFYKNASVNGKSGKVRISGHVAAALHYNRCLKEYGDKDSIQITDGMKIKVFYLVGDLEPLKLINNEYAELKSIALPTDIEVVPQWFLDNFHIDIDAHIERLVDNPLQNIIGALGMQVPSKQSLLVNSLFDF